MTILVIAFIIYGIRIGIFRDKNVLIEYIKKFGIFAPTLFIFIQIIQVVFPVIPGGASCLAGVLAFGPVEGFFYNEIGLVIGSVIAYYLAKVYGLKIINSLFKKEQVDKYLGYIRTNKFAICVVFNLNHKCIKTFRFDDENKSGWYDSKLLKAINKQVEELGWNKEEK